ncbi:MAG TPA: Ltp family lipoprotein [Solirubrobacteraceae bacterium]|nr:Ltp family lipoprotein [Solirubrobacteraceae bacterium]
MILSLVLTVAIIGCGGKPGHRETGSSVSTPARGVDTTAKRTPSLQSAFDAARYYLDTDAVSKSALLQRMGGGVGETYSEAEALYAVNHVDADWKAEALEDAKRRESPISPKRLMWYLTEDDLFSKAEATYALRHAGRDWNAEAVMAAKAAFDGDALPESQLAKELKLEGFTAAQVRYAVEKAH